MTKCHPLQSHNEYTFLTGYSELHEVVYMSRHRRHRHRHRVASPVRRIVTPWPCRMACLQRLAGTNQVS